MPYGTRRCQVFDELYSSTSQLRRGLAGGIHHGRRAGARVYPLPLSGVCLKRGRRPQLYKPHKGAVPLAGALAVWRLLVVVVCAKAQA